MSATSGTGAAPIGIADSGVGGLTVVRACRRVLPAEEILYLGDTAFFPYGERTDGEIRARVGAGATWLRAHGAKMIVLACNTASAVALREVRDALDVPVVGVIEAEAAAAARATRAGRVGLLATPATVRSQVYARALHEIDRSLALTAVPCPGLAAAIQDHGPEDPALAESLRRLCEPLVRARVDTVILGCTHYPAVAGRVAGHLPSAALIGAGAEAAGEIGRALARHGLGAPARGSPPPRFACTSDPDTFAVAGARLMGAPLGTVDLAGTGPGP